METNKQIEKLTHASFDKILKTSKQISKSWKHQGISLTVLQTLVDKSKMGDDVALNVEFKSNYNNMLDQLIKTCRQQSYMNSISYNDLKKNIKIMKRSFSEGLNK